MNGLNRLLVAFFVVLYAAITNEDAPQANKLSLSDQNRPSVSGEARSSAEHVLRGVIRVSKIAKVIMFLNEAQLVAYNLIPAIC